MQKVKSDIPKSNNDRYIKSYKQLEKANLDLDSPRIKKACFRLGIDIGEC